jgi:predicted transcriptional regulator
MRAMTLRLEDPLAFELGIVAEVDGVPVVEVVRRAVNEYVTRRAGDPRFVARLQDAAARAGGAPDAPPAGGAAAVPGEIVAMWQRPAGEDRGLPGFAPPEPRRDLFSLLAEPVGDGSAVPDETAGRFGPLM